MKPRYSPGFFIFKHPVIDQAWKGRFLEPGDHGLSTGTDLFLRFALEFLALLLICGKQRTPLREEPQPFHARWFLTGALIFFAERGAQARAASTRWHRSA
jgi:hypothetical protein